MIPFIWNSTNRQNESIVIEIRKWLVECGCMGVAGGGVNWLERVIRTLSRGMEIF